MPTVPDRMNGLDRVDVPPDGRPASERYNNPGAAWPDSRQQAKAFGAIGFGFLADSKTGRYSDPVTGLRGNNFIAAFNNPVLGLAYNISNALSQHVGRTLGATMATWSGRNISPGNLQSIASRIGVTPQTQLNREQIVAAMIANIDIEAGRRSSLSPAQIATAVALGIGGIPKGMTPQELRSLSMPELAQLGRAQALASSALKGREMETVLSTLSTIAPTAWGSFRGAQEAGLGRTGPAKGSFRAAQEEEAPQAAAVAAFDAIVGAEPSLGAGAAPGSARAGQEVGLSGPAAGSFRGSQEEGLGRQSWGALADAIANAPSQRAAEEASLAALDALTSREAAASTAAAATAATPSSRSAQETSMAALSALEGRVGSFATAAVAPSVSARAAQEASMAALGTPSRGLPERGPTPPSFAGMTLGTLGRGRDIATAPSLAGPATTGVGPSDLSSRGPSVSARSGEDIGFDAPSGSRGPSVSARSGEDIGFSSYGGSARGAEESSMAALGGYLSDLGFTSEGPSVSSRSGQDIGPSSSAHSFGPSVSARSAEDFSLSLQAMGFDVPTSVGPPVSARAAEEESMRALTETITATPAPAAPTVTTSSVAKSVTAPASFRSPASTRSGLGPAPSSRSGSGRAGFLSDEFGGGSYGTVEGSRGLDPGYSGFGSNFGGDVSSGFGFGGFGGFGADY